MSARLNLVVFIDGTGNNAFKQEACNWTNISRLWRACEHVRNDRVDQRVYYKPGVGTRQGEALTGSAVGAYLQDRVDEALSFLENERAKPSHAGKEIHVYLYGFSRGAYAVRCLAARYPYPIEVMGVFDTVRATLANRIDVSVAPDHVKNVFHAMAMDECRSDFDVTRFAPRENVEEVWFAGCHSDVGGYYVEGELSYIALNWMVERSVERGLLVDRSLIPSAPASYATMPALHNEKARRGWRLLDWLRGKSNFKRAFSALDIMHPSVGLFRSLGYVPACLPAGFPRASGGLVARQATAEKPRG